MWEFRFNGMESWSKFPDSMEFQSWKVNFRTEVCPRTADPQITMLWIKEVEIAKSIDELVTSRSITGQHNFPDFKMLDAMIASALKKLLNKQSNFREESKCRRAACSKRRPILTRKTYCVTWFTSISVQPELMKQYKDSQLCSLASLQNDDVQDFDVRWDQALYASWMTMPQLCHPGRIVQVKITRLCSTSDCLGFVRSRNRSK